jgi:anti-sigma B factor antagonist
MKHLIDRQEKYTLVSVEEDKLDAAVAPDLKSVFVAQGAEGVGSFIVDLHLVRYIDSSGLSALLTANRICNEKQGTLVIVAPTEHVMKLIKISQLDKVLNILPTVEEAIDLVFMNDLERDLQNEEE